MTSTRRSLLVLTLTLATACHMAHAQAPDTPALLAAQRQAMAALSSLDGVWRGTARVMLPGGQTREIVQTERIGNMLGGTIKVVEGRGYGADGDVQFNAFAVISFSPREGKYKFQSHAQGTSSDFILEPRPDGFVWWQRFGPMTIRFTTVIKDGTWTEIGERIVEGQAPQRTVEMTLRRLGPTDWPEVGAVPMK